MKKSFFDNLLQHIILVIILYLSPLNAENNTTVDKTYKIISIGVIELSEYLDTSISEWISTNEEKDVQCLSEPLEIINNKNFDEFFQDNKYLNETEDTYIRLRIKNYLYSREKNKVKLKLNAKIPFNRCKKEWQFFLQDVQGNKNEIKTTDTENGGIGIRYYREGFFGIKSNYSLGIRNEYPYVRARFRLPLSYKSWTLEPVQSFKYSNKYDLELETNIYIDNRIDDNQLFRLQLNRESGKHIQGIDYGLSLEYFSTLTDKSGFTVRQSFFGNTYYNDFYSFDKNYSGINNYVTSFSWRENIWRKWFYYEIKPTVNFHKDHDYSPSYSLRFTLDFYFGKYTK